jgi:hypothetical protein
LDYVWEDDVGETELTAIAVLAALVGGAAGARFTKAPIWKGVLIATSAAVAAIVVSVVPGVDRSLFMPIAGLVGAGVSGAALGLTAPQTAPIAIGAALVPLMGFLVLELNAG